MRTYSWKLLLTLAAAALFLTSCGDAGEVKRAGDVFVLVDAPSGSGFDAAIGGKVSLVGSCLGIDDAVVLWPDGTTISSEDPVAVDVPGEGLVTLGDSVSGAGGLVDVDDLPEGVEIPSDCPTDNIVSYRPE